MSEHQLGSVLDIECLIHFVLIHAELLMHLFLELSPEIRWDVHRNAFHVTDAEVCIPNQCGQMFRKRCLFLELIQQCRLLLFESACFVIGYATLEE